MKKLLGIIFVSFYFSLEAVALEYCSVVDYIKSSSKIEYLLCSGMESFSYKPLPFEAHDYLHPYKGYFKENFILKIPHGKVFGFDGIILDENRSFHELIWQRCYPSQLQVSNALSLPVQRYPRVAVIAQAGYTYYFHFLLEVLGRLALLDMHDIGYDFIYVPTSYPFMKELLLLWGIHPSKIISASNDIMVQADELIVPSLISRVQTNGAPRLAHYIPKRIVEHIRNRLLQNCNLVDENPCKYVFISRKDASFRKLLNEDDVFNLFEPFGFKRYILSELSILEQISLFFHAKIIIGPQGSGLSNVLFCDKKTLIFELLQARRDCAIYFLSGQLGLNYQPVKTVEFIDKNDGQYDTAIPLESLKDLLHAISLVLTKERKL